MDIIIIGGQKCGTTALFSFLSKHPQIRGSKSKELDFFSYEHHFNKGIEYYEQQFPKVFFRKKRNIKYLEASPSYILDEDPHKTAIRIYEYNPEVRLILLVRNPINRAFSAWQMYRQRFYSGRENWWIDWVKHHKPEVDTRNIKRRKPEEYNNFDLFIKNEISTITKDEAIECPVLSLGHYADGLTKYLKIIPKEQLLIIKSEEMLQNTPKVLSEITQYLGLKKYDWKNYSNKKVFEGNYSNTNITERTFDDLSAFYSSSNLKLMELTGINYN